LAKSDRRLTGRSGLAPPLNRLHGDVDKARGSRVIANLADIVIAMRGACKKERRVCGKQCGHCLGYDGGEVVFLNAIPDAEDELAGGLKHSSRFGIGSDAIGKEHCTKLAENDVKRAIVEWQVKRICLPPSDPLVSRLRGRESSIG
jgi:hypothetical protein